MSRTRLDSTTKVFTNPCPRNSECANYLISKTHSISPAWKLRSDPGFPHISHWEMYHARPSLLTVFSITQSDHSITLSRIQTNLLMFSLGNDPYIYPIKLMLTRKMPMLKAAFKSQKAYEITRAFLSSILKI